MGVAPSRATNEGVEGSKQANNTNNTAIDSFGDVYKSNYDSNHDSGFLSGSNLVSSSSLASEDCEAMRYSEPTPPETKGEALTSSRVDSGIDISEQLSSLHLASSSTSTSTSISELEGDDAPQRRTVTPPARKSRLGLSDEQVALLQEIFERDEDGDT